MWKSLFWLTIFCELFNPKKKKLNFSAIYKTITVILSLVFIYKVYFLKDLSKLQYQENLEKSSVQVKFDQECRNLNFIRILLLCFATESLDLNFRVQNIQINTNKPLRLRILLFLSFFGGPVKIELWLCNFFRHIQAYSNQSTEQYYHLFQTSRRILL